VDPSRGAIGSFPQGKLCWMPLEAALVSPSATRSLGQAEGGAKEKKWKKHATMLGTRFLGIRLSYPEEPG